MRGGETGRHTVRFSYENLERATPMTIRRCAGLRILEQSHDLL